MTPRAWQTSRDWVVGWTDIAIESGYYDQAHLIRDFRQFTGFTPVEHAARRNADGGVRGD